MKKFGEGQQPFHAIIDIPEGDIQELTTVTDQALNSLYGELFNLLQLHGINPTATTNADLKQVARAVWSAAATGNVFIDSGTADIKNLTHVKGGSFLYKNGVSADDGFAIEFVNKTENEGAVKVSVFDVENNANHFNLVPLLDNNSNELTGGALRAGNMVKARYDVSKNTFIMVSQFVFSAYVIDGDKTQEQINTLQKRKNAEFTSIFDFFTEEELTAYKAAPTTYDASKQLQAFFDYINQNNVGVADASGDFRTSKMIKFVGYSKTQTLRGLLILKPLVGFTDKTVFQFSPGYVYWYGGLDLRTGDYTYANRKADIGLLVGGDVVNGSFCYIDTVLTRGYRHCGIKCESKSTATTIRHAQAHACGSGANHSDYPAYSYQATTIANRVDNNANGTQQYTELDVSVLPPENLPTTLELALQVNGAWQLYSVVNVDRTTNKIRITPNLDRTVTTTINAHYVFGAGIYTVGGDASVLNFDSIWTTANSYGVRQGALYPAKMGSLISEFNLITLGIGSALDSASVGGTLDYCYTEGNKFDYVKCTRFTPNFTIANDVAFSVAKSVALGATRASNSNDLFDFMQIIGLTAMSNGERIKYEHYFSAGQTSAFDITDLDRRPRLQGLSDNAITIPIATPNFDNATKLGYVMRKVILFAKSVKDMSMSNTITFTLPTGYTLYGGGTSYVLNGLQGITELTFVVDVYNKLILIGNNRSQKTATATYDPPSLATATQQSTTVTLTGAKLGDNISVSFNQPLQGTRMWSEVTAENTVTVYHRNDTGAAVDLASGTLTVKIL